MPQTPFLFIPAKKLIFVHISEHQLWPTDPTPLTLTSTAPCF